MEKELNVAFEIYNTHGELVDTIEGPGDTGNWLNQPETHAEVAMIPAPPAEAAKKLTAGEFLPIKRIPLNGNGEPMNEQAQDMFMYLATGKEAAIELAKALGCENIYWSAWDGVRYIEIIDLKSGDTEMYSHDDAP